MSIEMLKNVNRNVSREPNFWYATILLKKMKENYRKMSTENPILGTHIVPTRSGFLALGRNLGNIFPTSLPELPIQLREAYILQGNEKMRERHFSKQKKHLFP